MEITGIYKFQNNLPDGKALNLFLKGMTPECFKVVMYRLLVMSVAK